MGWTERDSAAELAGTYDVFLVDQFGTLHDGHGLYPGARSALRRLRAAGGRVALLSNSGRRSAPNMRRLAAMGIGEGEYDLFLTSGELGWTWLRGGRLPVARPGARCLLLERSGDGSVLDGLDLVSVRDPLAAQLVLIAGSEGDQRSLDEYAGLLAPAARAGVPALCLNPDRIMLTPSGRTFGAGQIGELYQRLGGSVEWIGKPYPALYDAALRAMGDPDRARVAGVGDSIEHDIAGGRRSGCDAWLVRAGIIADADDAVLVAECARFGAEPDGVLRRF